MTQPRASGSRMLRQVILTFGSLGHRVRGVRLAAFFHRLERLVSSDRSGRGTPWAHQAAFMPPELPIHARSSGASRRAAARLGLGYGLVVVIAFAAGDPSATGQAHAAGDEISSDVEMSPISGAPEAPRRHTRLRDAAELDERRAAGIYDIVSGALAKGYARGRLEVVKGYQSWTRHNRAPYLSATHGNHYINNYANPIARNYGRFEEAGRFPVGSVLAKDSFAVSRTGSILLGPLFVMEKMPPGFSYVTGDWRYTLVRPDGTVFGQTAGEGSERVEYCIGCHLAVEHQDHLYFVPEAFRVRPR